MKKIYRNLKTAVLALGCMSTTVILFRLPG